MSLNPVFLSSKTVEWATPQDLFDKLNAEFHFTLDPCATEENAKCARFYTKETDGLAQDWSKDRVFMNPPYGNSEYVCKKACKKKKCRERGHCNLEFVPGIAEWMCKARMSASEGALVVCLVPARTDTIWWHRYAMEGEIRYIKGRLTFGGADNCAPFANVLVIFRPSK